MDVLRMVASLLALSLWIGCGSDVARDLDDGDGEHAGDDDDSEARRPMSADRAEEIVAQTRRIISDIRHREGALADAPSLEGLGYDAVDSDVGVGGLEDYLCASSCSGEAEEGGCSLKGCDDGADIEGWVEWTPTEVYSLVTERTPSSSEAGEGTSETTLEIELADAGPGLSGKLRIESSISNDSRFDTKITFVYEDACAAGGSLEVDVEGDDGGRARHTFEHDCD